MNEDGDFSDESANMMEEEFIDGLPDLIVEESGIKRSTEIALHSYSRDPSLVCVNIAILKKKVGRGRSRQVTNRSISTALFECGLRVNALFECGSSKRSGFAIQMQRQIYCRQMISMTVVVLYC